MHRAQKNLQKSLSKNISKTKANSAKLSAFSDSAPPIYPQNDSTSFAFLQKNFFVGLCYAIPSAHNITMTNNFLFSPKAALFFIYPS